jgi:hypothetical protein
LIKLRPHLDQFCVKILHRFSATTPPYELPSCPLDTPATRARSGKPNSHSGPVLPTPTNALTRSRGLNALNLRACPLTLAELLQGNRQEFFWRIVAPKRVNFRPQLSMPSWGPKRTLACKYCPQGRVYEKLVWRKNVEKTSATQIAGTAFMSISPVRRNRQENCSRHVPP